MIVPLSAGSAADILARQLALKMGESWSQPVVVENRPGAGTTLGTDAVAKAAPDGHTLLVNSAAFAASAAIYQKLPYDPLKDFAPVSQVAIAPIVVVVAPRSAQSPLKISSSSRRGSQDRSTLAPPGSDPAPISPASNSNLLPASTLCMCLIRDRPKRFWTL
jgi:hypothetical protein